VFGAVGGAAEDAGAAAAAGCAATLTEFDRTLGAGCGGRSVGMAAAGAISGAVAGEGSAVAGGCGRDFRGGGCLFACAIGSAVLGRSG